MNDDDYRMGLAQLQQELAKRLAQQGRAVPTRRTGRTATRPQISREEARAMLIAATGQARPNHEWSPDVGNSCLRCASGSPFRQSRKHHLFLIQEEP